MRPRWGAAGTLLAALVALAGIWSVFAPAGVSAAPAIQLTAGFAAGARLGAGTEMHAELRIDPRRLHSQLTGVRVLYPKGLGLVASGLGLASCTRPPSDFQQVLISGPKLGGCSPNAVLGYGTVEAQVRLLDGQVIPEYATATVLSGPFRQGVLGLVVFVDGQHPFGAKLAYAGELSGPTGPFGGAIVVRMPAIPSIADLATVALTDMRLSIGSRRITYYNRVGGRSIPYHPEGIVLPGRCPKGGFRFRTQLAFQDGRHVRADASVSCARFATAATG